MENPWFCGVRKYWSENGHHILRLLTKVITQILCLISTIIIQVVHEISECYVCGIQ